MPTRLRPLHVHDATSRDVVRRAPEPDVRAGRRAVTAELLEPRLRALRPLSRGSVRLADRFKCKTCAMLRCPETPSQAPYRRDSRRTGEGSFISAREAASVVPGKHERGPLPGPAFEGPSLLQEAEPHALLRLLSRRRKHDHKLRGARPGRQAGHPKHVLSSCQWPWSEAPVRVRGLRARRHAVR